MANTRARLALRLVGRSRPCAATIVGMAAYAVLVRTQAMADWVHVAAVLLIAALTVAGAALAQKKLAGRVAATAPATRRRGRLTAHARSSGQTCCAMCSASAVPQMR